MLYVRSEERKNTIKEIFDTDIVVPELEKFFTLDFYRINAEENPEILKRYRLPSLVLFSGGREVRVLEGIKTWNEYLGALSCL
ncbi:MAG: thioredoxin [Aquificaceae bacterium]